ncbi:MAG: hypothetical protein AB1405_13900, partial [Bdellovibrionota bacterium]
MAHSRFWAYPENLGDLKIYEYAPDFKATEIKDLFSDCGEGVVARHCPPYESLPLSLRLRYRARWLLGKSFFSGTREVASGLVWDESRFYFLSLSEGAVYAFDKEGTDPLWVSDAATGYACDSSLVPVGAVLYLACRHDLGRKWSVFALDAKTGEPLAGASLESELSALIPGPEGVLVLLSDGSLWKWSAGQEKCAHFLDLGDAFHRVSDFLPGPLRIEAPWTSSEGLLVLGGKTNVWVIDPSAGTVRWKTPVSGVVRGLKASAIENRLWVVTSAAEILTLELSGGVQLA